MTMPSCEAAPDLTVEQIVSAARTQNVRARDHATPAFGAPPAARLAYKLSATPGLRAQAPPDHGRDLGACLDETRAVLMELGFLMRR